MALVLTKSIIRINGDESSVVYKTDTVLSNGILDLININTEIYRDLYFVLDRPGKYVYHYIVKDNVVKDNGLKVIEDSTPVGIVSI